jgi:phosphonate transport system permease protein
MKSAAQRVPFRVSPPWTRRRIGFHVLAITILILVGFGWHEIGMGVSPLIFGIGHIFTFLGQTVPPQFPDVSHTIRLALVTVCMAVVGTAFAMVLSVPVAFLAARNTTVHPALRWLARALIVACRSVPDLIFAIVFVEALGIGVLPGVLALALHSVGMVGKLYAEAIEETPPGPCEAVTSTGASRTQIITTSVVPEFLPSFWSIALYRLDMNLRSSVILGYVGAGGIGLLLNTDMGELQFRQALGVVIVIFVLIVLMEVVSAVIRRSLIGMESLPTAVSSRQRPTRGDRIVSKLSQSCRPILPIGAFDRERLRPPWTGERVQRLSFLIGAAIILGISFWDTKTSPWQPLTQLGPIWHTITLYFPPDFSTAHGLLLTGTLQSASVALVATAIGYLIAVPIGLLAARNVTSPWMARTTRGLLVAARAVPELILAIIFVVAVGLGLVAGTFALIVGTVAMMSKLIADGIEGVPSMPREAVISVGATRTQEAATSIILPSAPSLVGNGFYMLDINFRSSTILGIVGGGGIGFLLSQSVNVLAYTTTGAIIVSTFAVVLLIELVTSWVRKHLILFTGIRTQPAQEGWTVPISWLSSSDGMARRTRSWWTGLSACMPGAGRAPVFESGDPSRSSGSLRRQGHV